mmetsp:Transcript_6167/g.15219  ORF Transcript_6167/g.15219 Transcript_6167/m.15219 type:complete len:1108 (-) Transcript_6167:661-3984(-)
MAETHKKWGLSVDHHLLSLSYEASFPFFFFLLVLGVGVFLLFGECKERIRTGHSQICKCRRGTRKADRRTKRNQLNEPTCRQEQQEQQEQQRQTHGASEEEEESEEEENERERQRWLDTTSRPASLVWRDQRYLSSKNGSCSPPSPNSFASPPFRATIHSAYETGLGSAGSLPIPASTVAVRPDPVSPVQTSEQQEAGINCSSHPFPSCSFSSPVLSFGGTGMRGGTEGPTQVSSIDLGTRQEWEATREWFRIHFLAQRRARKHRVPSSLEPHRHEHGPPMEPFVDQRGDKPDQYQGGVVLFSLDDAWGRAWADTWFRGISGECSFSSPSMPFSRANRSGAGKQQSLRAWRTIDDIADRWKSLCRHPFSEEIPGHKQREVFDPNTGGLLPGLGEKGDAAQGGAAGAEETRPYDIVGDTPKETSGGAEHCFSSGAMDDQTSFEMKDVFSMAMETWDQFVAAIRTREEKDGRSQGGWRASSLSETLDDLLSETRKPTSDDPSARDGFPQVDRLRMISLFYLLYLSFGYPSKRPSVPPPTFQQQDTQKQVARESSGAIPHVLVSPPSSSSSPSPSPPSSVSTHFRSPPLSQTIVPRSASPCSVPTTKEHATRFPSPECYLPSRVCIQVESGLPEWQPHHMVQFLRKRKWETIGPGPLLSGEGDLSAEERRCGEKEKTRASNKCRRLDTHERVASPWLVEPQSVQDARYDIFSPTRKDKMEQEEERFVFCNTPLCVHQWGALIDDMDVVMGRGLWENLKGLLSSAVSSTPASPASISSFSQEASALYQLMDDLPPQAFQLWLAYRLETLKECMIASAEVSVGSPLENSGSPVSGTGPDKIPVETPSTEPVDTEQPEAGAERLSFFRDRWDRDREESSWHRQISEEMSQGWTERGRRERSQNHLLCDTRVRSMQLWSEQLFCFWTTDKEAKLPNHGRWGELSVPSSCSSESPLGAERWIASTPQAEHRALPRYGGDERSPSAPSPSPSSHASPAASLAARRPLSSSCGDPPATSPASPFFPAVSSAEPTSPCANRIPHSPCVDPAASAPGRHALSQAVSSPQGPRKSQSVLGASKKRKGKYGHGPERLPFLSPPMNKSYQRKLKAKWGVPNK